MLPILINSESQCPIKQLRELKQKVVINRQVGKTSDLCYFFLLCFMQFLMGNILQQEILKHEVTVTMLI